MIRIFSIFLGFPKEEITDQMELSKSKQFNLSYNMSWSYKTHWDKVFHSQKRKRLGRAKNLVTNKSFLSLWLLKYFSYNVLSVERKWGFYILVKFQLKIVKKIYHASIRDRTWDLSIIRLVLYHWAIWSVHIWLVTFIKFIINANENMASAAYNPYMLEVNMWTISHIKYRSLALMV